MTLVLFRPYGDKTMVKRNDTTKKNNGKVEFTDIVWCIDNLSSDELEEHDKKPKSFGDAYSDICVMIEDGFKLSIRWDDYSNGYMVSATCLDKKYQNAGLAISARSNDLEDCLSILVFKYMIVANRDLRAFADKLPRGVRG